MIYLGADHRGFELKEKLKKFLESIDFDYKDLGAYEKNEKDDYTDFSADVARFVRMEKDNRGIVICGSGVGVDIICNKHFDIRCGLCFNKQVAELARKHTAINICAIPADFVSFDVAKDIVITFLKTDFSFEDQHSRRLAKIIRIEENKLP
ncbi:RpiB/LacA/LacB family sugar-phosphate isomerase [Patescibacteria group bacterium]|nr:RpiB/LacA/LacB family sugar-phosphate isomerase [Patescibacteria group bacterium]